MRLSDIVFMALRDLGVKIEERDSAGVSFTYNSRKVVVGWRDSTGPVSRKMVEAWLRENIDEHHLLVMGWFHEEVKSWALSRRGPKLCIYQLGLRDYFQEPRGVEITSKFESDVEKALIRAFDSRELKIDYSRCKYCSARAVSSCEVCGALLCSRHAIYCPVCGAVVCHPDTEARCFYIHEHG